MGKQDLYARLRAKYPLFVYEGYEELPLAEASVSYSARVRYRFVVYDADGREAFVFRPEWRIPSRPFYAAEAVPSALWRNLLFQLGMAELVSYWKATASPVVEIRCPAGVCLDDTVVAFWKKLYFNGLGEYFYLNGLHEVTQADFMTVKVKAVADGAGLDSGVKAGRTGATPRAVQATPDVTYGAEEMSLSPRVIVPIGGGKDSVVTWEVLSRTRAEGADGLLPLVLNPRGATLGCCAVGGKAEEDIAVLNRRLDPLLLELNAAGFLNGHTPFSALLAFATLVAAALTGRRYIALSNESSANESTVPGGTVNHQYSKSFEFEDDFRQYVARYVSPSFYYFSFLRPLSELAIARVFSELKPYHAVFKSCNAGSKQDVWCGHCAKCLFAYIIFSPFLPQAGLERVFGRNLFADAGMLPLLKELDGETPVKPFECVGTVAEVNWALQQLRPLAESAAPGVYPLLEAYFASDVSRRPVSDKVWRGLFEPHALPPEFLAGLETYLREAHIFD
ncbi:MAG: hypothetical protein K2O01_00065 [Bacteroidales bacterium]|nr:hypothetical protein [Bacteroidales bacterium]